jgi:hypothetical protein
VTSILTVAFQRAMAMGFDNQDAILIDPLTRDTAQSISYRLGEREATSKVKT